MRLALALVLVSCSEANHPASANVSRFNWNFEKIHTGGLRIPEQQEEVNKVLEDMSAEIDFGYRDVSEKYAARVQKLFDVFRENIQGFRRTLSAKRICDEEYERPKPRYDDPLTFEILNAREYQTNATDDPVYQAGVDDFLYETWESIRTLNFSEALPDQAGFEPDAHVTPELIQFVSLTEGSIYELKTSNYSELVDRFDGSQAENYPQTQPYFRQFFGSADDDVLVVLDASSAYGEKLRAGIAGVGRAIIGTLNLRARAKVIVLANEMAVSGVEYGELEEAQEEYEKFINESFAQDLGVYLSESTLLRIVDSEIHLHQQF